MARELKSVKYRQRVVAEKHRLMREEQALREKLEQLIQKYGEDEVILAARRAGVFDE